MVVLDSGHDRLFGRVSHHDPDTGRATVAILGFPLGETMECNSAEMMVRPEILYTRSRSRVPNEFYGVAHNLGVEIPTH